MEELEITGCPQCAAPAEIVDRFELPSTDGPIVHVKIQCVHRHWFLGPAAGEGVRMDTPRSLTHRDRAILRAVARGGAQLVVSSEPDLFLDGRCCSDQLAARRLAHAGLIAAAAAAGPGQRVPAELTRAGRELLAG